MSLKNEFGQINNPNIARDMADTEDQMRNAGLTKKEIAGTHNLMEGFHDQEKKEAEKAEQLEQLRRGLIREDITTFDADYGNAGEALKLYLTQGVESGDFSKAEDLMEELRKAIDGVKTKYQRGIIEHL